MKPTEELLEPIRRVFGWLLGLRAEGGRIVCPDHGIEHTGKSAGVIVMACVLARVDPEANRDGLKRIAVEQGLRLLENLQREGESTCFTFRPGRHDPYNCSNNVIDGGACADALAELVRTFGPELEPEQRERLRDAAVLHAQTYLRYAILDKGITAQRAWAMTGVAGAFELSGHEVLELAVREGEQLVRRAQNADGSFPYHPRGGADQEGQDPGHPGASDVSSFYQSRVTAFTLFSLQCIGADPTASGSREHILRGLDFLLGLQGPDGIKCGLVEAKPWYWGAEYEVASHPFDIYALARGWAQFRMPRFANGARRAWRSWVEHLEPDGRPRSHMPGPGRSQSYQCPVFWAGHASWAARALPDLVEILSSPEPSLAPPDKQVEISTTRFADADLVRLEDGVVTAWVRGARPRFNVHHGSPHGSGLLRVVQRDGGEPLLDRRPGARLAEGEWSGAAGLPSIRRGWGAGSGELRFSLWLARNAWRGGRRLEALLTPARVATRGILQPAGTRISSAYDPAPGLDLVEAGVTLEGRLARPDGSPLRSSSIVRDFAVTGTGLFVEERLIADGGARRVRFRVPAQAHDVHVERNRVRYRLGGEGMGVPRAGNLGDRSRP